MQGSASEGRTNPKRLFLIDFHTGTHEYGRYAEIYIHHLYADTGCYLENVL